MLASLSDPRMLAQDFLFFLFPLTIPFLLSIILADNLVSGNRKPAFVEAGKPMEGLFREKMLTIEGFNPQRKTHGK